MKSVKVRHIRTNKFFEIGEDVYQRDPHKWELVEESKPEAKADEKEQAPEPEPEPEVEEKKAEPELKHKALFICPKCSKEYKSEKAFKKHVAAHKAS